MPKTSKQATRAAQARHTARLLLQRRTELSLLATKARTGSKLTEGQKAHARNLIVSIKNLKNSIEEMGLHVDEAISWAIHDEKNRGKRRKTKMRSGNGIGMYSLGNSIKAWR